MADPCSLKFPLIILLSDLKHDRALGASCFNRKRIQSSCVSPFGNPVLYDLFRVASLSFFDAFGMNTITLLFRYSSRRYSVGMEGRAYKSNCGKRALTAPTVLVDRLSFLDAVSLQWPISINGTPLERTGAPHHSSHFSLSTSCPPRLVPPSIFCVSRAPRMGYSLNMPPYNHCHPNRDRKPSVHRLRISTKTDHVWYTRRPSVI